MKNRNVILYIAMSLDGYIAKQNGSIDWIANNINYLEEDNTYEAFYQNVDTVILGRKTYEQIIKELSPDSYPYSDSESFVLTSNLNATKSFSKATFTNQNVCELVKELKVKKGQNIWIVGGNSIIDPLVNNNLIDEYIIAVIPTILGSGIPLFDKIDSEKPLKHINSYVKNQITYLTFKKNFGSLV